jgi:ABC-type multidrug transport system permease subunit
MHERKLKHLEFIQTVITRMNTNSFLIKGWSVTLITGLFALAAKDANIKYVLISYFIIPIFWILDGFYISTERRYRALYDVTAVKKDDAIDFSMKVKDFEKQHSWLNGIFSKTLVIFYVALVCAVLLVMYFLSK